MTDHPVTVGAALDEYAGYELVVHLEGGHTITGTLKRVNAHLWSLNEEATRPQEEDQVRYEGQPPSTTVFAAGSVVAFTVEG